MTRNGNTALRVTHGFTLIELMVVLVILALVAGLIAPSAIGALRRSGIRSQGEDLAELLHFAQRYAVTTRKPVQVNLDSARGICWVSAIRTTLPWKDTGPGAAAGPTLGTLKLQPGIMLTTQVSQAHGSGDAPWRSLLYQSDGTTDDALLQLSDGRGMLVELLVGGSDGSVQLRERAA